VHPSHEKFFDAIDTSCKIKLPDGELLYDTAVIENFDKILDVDVDKLWLDVNKLGAYSPEERIVITSGYDPRWVPGNNGALKYRGNAVARDKIWFQSGDYDKGLFRYGYTGWQYAVSGATVRASTVPAIKKMFETFNEKYDVKNEMNAFILTRYKTGKDCIGLHSDKTHDFASDSVFVVMKLGESRLFELSWDEPAVVAAKAALKLSEVGAKKAKGEEEAAAADKLKGTKAADMLNSAKAAVVSAADELKSAKAALKSATKNRQHKEIFWSKELKAGTGIIFGTAANARVKHGVPAITKSDHLSGSIVGRCIKTVISWDDIKKKLEGLEKQKTKKRKAMMED
jgi:hypothetical protein